MLMSVRGILITVMVGTARTVLEAFTVPVPQASGLTETPQHVKVVHCIGFMEIKWTTSSKLDALHVLNFWQKLERVWGNINFIYKSKLERFEMFVTYTCRHMSFCL